MQMGAIRQERQTVPLSLELGKQRVAASGLADPLAWTVQPAHAWSHELAKAGRQGGQAVVGHRQALQPRELPNASGQLREHVAVKQQHLQDSAVCTVKMVKCQTQA